MPVYPADELAPGTPGAEIEEAYQYEFRGLVFGAQTDIIVSEVTGLLSMPSVEPHDGVKDYGHGVNPGLLTMGKRIISFNVSIIGSAGVDIEQKISEVSAAFQVPRLRYSRVLEPLVYQRPGQNKRQMFVRCTKRDFTSSYRTARGLSVGSVEFQAPDPRIYSLDAFTVPYSLLPGETTGTFQANAIGDFADGTLPTVTIEGPATNPTIGNLDDDSRFFKLNVVLTAADGVRVDFKNQRIEKRIGLAGEWEEDFSILAIDSKWWAVLPGINDIQVTRAVGNTAAAMDVSVTYYDVWQ